MLFAVIAALAPVWHVYVSADGNDHNDGRSWKSAYRTIQHALDAARKEGGSRTIEYDGAFQLDHTLVLDKSLSGLRLVGNGAISTAYVVTGWKPDTFNGIHMWSAPAPAGAEPREMFVGPNLVRAPRPRLPSKGFYHLAGLTNGAMEKPWNEGQTEALYKAGDLSDMKNLGDVELVAHHFWVTSRLPIESIDD
ncbi:MAG TPA: hypothetical protein VG944_24255, partial [Fimbriimonas sp.]|nr:hypothetical protein [Fimbriimonas sp.]